MTDWHEIFQNFYLANLDDLATANNEDGLHAHIKQERAAWVKRAIEFTIAEMEKK